MKTINISINNVLGIATALMRITGAVCVTGRNAQGKSSIAVAIAAVLSRDSNPLSLSASEKKSYVHDGARDGVVTVETDGHHANWRPGTGDADTIQATASMPAVPPECTGLVDFTRAQSGAGRTELLQPIVDASAGDIDKDALLRDELTRIFGDDKPAADEIADAVKRDGWTPTHDHWRELRVAKKALWESVAGERWGGPKAAAWQPRDWTPELSGMTRADAAADVTAAEQAVRDLDISGAISDAEHQQAVDAQNHIEIERAEQTKILEHVGCCKRDLTDAKAVVPPRDNSADAMDERIDRQRSQIVALQAAASDELQRKARAAADAARDGWDQTVRNNEGYVFAAEQTRDSAIRAKQLAEKELAATTGGARTKCPSCGAELAQNAIGEHITAADLDAARAAAEKKLAEVNDELTAARDAHAAAQGALDTAKKQRDDSVAEATDAVKKSQVDAPSPVIDAARAELDKMIAQRDAPSESSAAAERDAAIEKVNQCTSALARAERDLRDSKTREKMYSDRAAKSSAHVWTDSDQQRLVTARDEVERARRRADAVVKMQDASDARESVLRADAVVGILAPSGLRAKLITAQLEPLHGALLSICALAEWPTVVVNHSRAITCDGRPIQLCSESEKLRVQYAMQFASASLMDARVIILDGVDALDDPARSGLCRVTEAFLAHHGGAAIVVAAATEHGVLGSPFAQREIIDGRITVA